MADQQSESKRRGWGMGPIVTVGALALVASGAITALLVNIVERKQEAKKPLLPRRGARPTRRRTPRSGARTSRSSTTPTCGPSTSSARKYGGSEALPRTPTDADPRSVIAQSRLEEDPRLRIMWAGYAFAVDFRKKRGHAYMLDDQTFTERVQQFKQPGTCIHCHASVYVPYKKAGGGDLIKGFEHFNQMPYTEARKHFKHPVACIDCHDPKTMALRVTRPGFLEGIRALKASQGVRDYDPNTQATRQEMRSFVCGQCHVEYYFKGPEKRLTYPWAQGAQGRRDRRLLRRGRASRTGRTAISGHRAAQGPAPRVRDVEPGHPRALGRRLRRLPHALPARRGAEGQRPPRAQPAAQHQQCLPDLPQVAGAGAAGAGGD